MGAFETATMNHEVPLKIKFRKISLRTLIAYNNITGQTVL